MIRTLKIFALIVVALLFQISVFPEYLADPFKPNLLIIFVVCLGLREPVKGGWAIAALTGLVQDCFSGLYLGLNGMTYLVIYLSLRMVADVLYADSRYLITLMVVLATFAAGIMQLLLLAIYSAANGLYATLLADLFSQALVNALCAALVSTFLYRFTRAEIR
jgi:rod shape-determining protein MreD